MLAQVALYRFPTRKQQDFLKLIDMSNQDSSFSHACSNFSSICTWYFFVNVVIKGADRRLCNRQYSS